MEKTSYNIYKGDYFKVSEKLNKQYDLIIFDPPYDVYSTKDVLDKAAEYNLLKDNGIILYEEFYKTNFIENNTFSIYDERKYGDTIIRFLRYTKGE